MTIQWIDDGRLKNGVFTVIVTDKFKSANMLGYRLKDETVDQLINEDCEFIVFVEVDGRSPGRYTISMEDWLDYRTWADADIWQHVSKSLFDRG